MTAERKNLCDLNDGPLYEGGRVFVIVGRGSRHASIHEAGAVTGIVDVTGGVVVKAGGGYFFARDCYTSRRAAVADVVRSLRRLRKKLLAKVAGIDAVIANLESEAT